MNESILQLSPDQTQHLDAECQRLEQMYLNAKVRIKAARQIVQTQAGSSKGIEITAWDAGTEGMTPLTYTVNAHGKRYKITGDQCQCWAWANTYGTENPCTHYLALEMVQSIQRQHGAEPVSEAAAHEPQVLFSLSNAVYDDTQWETAMEEAIGMLTTAGISQGPIAKAASMAGTPGHVVFYDNHTVEVHSITSDETYHFDPVSGCTCAYATQRQEGWCSHLMAVELLNLVHEMTAGRRLTAETQLTQALVQSTNPTEASDMALSEAPPTETSDLPEFDQPEPLPDSKTFLRPLKDIYADLKKPPKQRHLLTKQVPGKYNATYMPHTWIRNYLDHYAPGWSWQVDIKGVDGKIYVRGTLTIHGLDGSVARDGLGNESEDVSSYGDPSSNAEAQALRRAAMSHGFCRALWDR